MKTQLMKRAAALCLAVVLTLSVNAAALFGGKEKAKPAEGSPTAQALEIRTYRGIPYHAQFLAAGGEGEDLTFTVEKEPKKGTVQIDGRQLHLYPRGGFHRKRQLHLYRHRQRRTRVSTRYGERHH